MKADTNRIMRKVTNASAGVALAAAFFNVALLLVQLVKTVSEDETIQKAAEKE